MGRRKKAVKKVVKKKRAVVSKIFKCLFCNTEKSVICQLDTKSMTGSLECAVCHAKFQTQIHKLTEPIDIFTEWLDEAADAQARAAKRYTSEVRRQQEEADTEQAEEDIADLDDGGYEEED